MQNSGYIFGLQGAGCGLIGGGLASFTDNLFGSLSIAVGMSVILSVIIYHLEAIQNQ